MDGTSLFGSPFLFLWVFSCKNGQRKREEDFNWGESTMDIHPLSAGKELMYRPSFEEDLGKRPFTDYFQRTGPLVDVYETMDEVIVSCELAGLDNKEDVSIHVEKNSLTINGIVHQARIVQDRRYHRTERFYGNFYRVVELPSSVREETAKAVYKNGILEIRMKKLNPTTGKPVDIHFQ
jgi:HSP20 family protein